MEYLVKELKKNIDHLSSLYERAIDYTERKFTVNDTDAVILSIDGLMNKETAALTVMKPILESTIPVLGGEAIEEYAVKHIFSAPEIIKLRSISDVNARLMSGFAVLLFDGSNTALAFGVQGSEKRSIEEPENEAMQRGAKDGFNEHYQTNISLIRRRMRTTDLKFERMYVGETSKTPVVLCYLESRAPEKLLRDIRHKLHSCNLKNLMAAGYLSGYIQKSGLFGNVGLTERPDTLCGKISEGRIAIIVDGTPTSIIVPHLFIENFQSLDDYANRPFYSSIIRILRYISFIIAVFLPGIYISIVMHRPELLPGDMLIKIATDEEKTPFPVLWEILLVNLLYEIMREAGLRAPKALSQSVSIVGALVIGDTAVSSGIIGATPLMIIASSAIAGYAVPKLYEQVALLRFVLIVVGGLLGPWSIALSIMLLIFCICSEETEGMPLLTPLSPFSFKAMEDVFIRAPWVKLSKTDYDIKDTGKQ